MAEKRYTDPKKYPDVILKTLVREYDRPGATEVRDIGMEIHKLALKSGLFAEFDRQQRANEHPREMYEAVRVLVEKNLVQVLERDAQRLKPTLIGLERGRFLNRSWFYRRLYHPIGSDLRTAVISMVFSVITAVLTVFVLMRLGLMD